MDQPINNQPTPPAPTVNPPPPVTSVPKKNFPLILVVVLILVAIASGIVIGKYFLGQKASPSTNQVVPTLTQPTLIPTPTPDLTADWKTYRNKEFGFEFKYPADWKLNELKNPPFRNIIYGIANIDTQQPSNAMSGGPSPKIIPYSINISILQNNTNESGKNFIINTLGFSGQLDQSIYLLEETISGYKCFKSTTIPDMFGRHDYFFESKDKSKYINFSYSPVWGEIQKEEKTETYLLFTQILSTFKFLEQQRL